MSKKPDRVTHTDIARSYAQFPSFTDRLPWRDYNEKYQCFLLEDRKSVGVCFKVTPIPCEAKPQKMMEEIARSISEALKNSIPCEKESPWILQVYIQKTPNLNDEYAKIEDYFYANKRTTLLAHEYLANIKEHFTNVSSSEGLFHDSQVTNAIFRGGVMQVYAVLYRRIKTEKTRRYGLEDIHHISNKFMAQLRTCGMQIKRMKGSEFYSWMVRWFSSKERYIPPLPDNHNKPIGFDFAEQLFFNAPQSFEEGWIFDGLPHKLLTIQNMTVAPEVGHISAERRRQVDDKVFNLMDHLPECSIFVINVVFQSPQEVALHLKSIHDSAIGHHAEAIKVKSEVELAEKSMTEGDYLFPVVMGVYLRAESINDLHAKEAQTEVLLNANGFKVITDNELFPVDAYLRYLPMCYDFSFDQRFTTRSKYILLSDIAKLLPFYGRSRGTGHPGMVLFNRGGEPWTYDLMKDKSKNAHLLVLGETGTGKSNLLNLLIVHTLALYGSRFFIIDAGGSFDLLGDYCKSYGLTVNKIKIDPKRPVSLNPFVSGLQVIDQLEAIELDKREKFLADACHKLIQEQENNAKKIADTNDIDEPRDILGDMVLAALIMITGGEKREEEAIRRSDRMLIMDAIIDSAYFVKEQKRTQMIASDIVDAFERIALNLDPERENEKIRRAREMADAMRYFTKDPVSSRFFNSYGNPWELADLTIIDLGLFAREGYEAQRSLAFAGCMNNILALAEQNQQGNRDIKVICDENHIITSISLLADIQTRIAKMGRKLGLWLWIATQNMKDFADSARRMLSQIETWLCLALPPDEIQQILKFKVLTEEQIALFLSARKEKGKYTEGVVLSPKINALIRNVPPPLYLEMAATDQDEKHARFKLILELGCSEIEAVKIMAKQKMNTSQRTNSDD